jgi:hypothetical protein
MIASILCINTKAPNHTDTLCTKMLVYDSTLSTGHGRQSALCHRQANHNKHCLFMRVTLCHMQHSVEDTKAGKYERGKLLITTLRLVWFSSHSSIINLCIGIQTIHTLDMSTKARSGEPFPSVCLQGMLKASSSTTGGR